MTTTERDDAYRELLLEPIRKCANYLPRMGGPKGGAFKVDLAGFQAAYGADALYHWIGLDSSAMYAAHKAAGGMTSVYRQLGIGCERLFRAILQDELALDSDQVTWSYDIVEEDDDEDVDEDNATQKVRTLALDGRIELSDLSDPAAERRVREWLEAQSQALNITVPLRGAVFEVRQGYKSADSKRQHGDLANAAQALGEGFLPVLVLMSNQINQTVNARYRVHNWAVLRGVLSETDGRDPLTSTFDFMQAVIGYDLVGFFTRNTASLRSEIESIVANLLEAK